MPTPICLVLPQAFAATSLRSTRVATVWSYQSDTQIVVTLRDDIRFGNASSLSRGDVVFTIKRITDPAFKSPQLSQSYGRQRWRPEKPAGNVDARG
jgi:ABC-type transport system substrate-binding protein